MFYGCNAARGWHVYCDYDFGPHKFMSLSHDIRSYVPSQGYTSETRGFWVLSHKDLTVRVPSNVNGSARDMFLSA
jgi:hypothetical protein